MRNFLQKWSVEFNVTRTAVTCLLKFLNERFPFLPKDSRALLGTPRNIKTISVPPGKYFHISIVSNLEQIYQNRAVPENISLICNSDVLPVFKDSNYNSFWVVLGKLDGDDDKVFLIGLYHGANKPTNFYTFLKPFVDECIALQDILILNKKSVKFSIKLFSVDAPARAAMLGIRQFNAYFGCHKCKV